MASRRLPCRRPLLALGLSLVVASSFWCRSAPGAGGAVAAVPVGRIACGSGGAQASAAGQDDLLVFGAGFLGKLAAQKWLERHPSARVVGVTRSDASHEELRKMGVEPHTAGADLAAAAPIGGFPNVIFAAPPSGGRPGAPAAPGSYAESIREAQSHWDGKGGFVFTSSGGVFKEDAGGTVDETSPVSDTPRTAVLLEAEKLVREVGGTVLRLAGLYDILRGAHAYWLKVGVITGSKDGVLNLLHYEDAAEAALTALDRGSAVRGDHGVQLRCAEPVGELFIVGDGVPTTRLEIVQSARQAPQFADAAEPVFEVPPEQMGKPSGKVYNVRRATDVLRWTPRYKSFAQFITMQR